MNKIISNILNTLRVPSSNDKSVVASTQINAEAQVVLPLIPQTPSTPTQLLYPEDTTTNSTVSTSKDESTQGILIVIKFIFYAFVYIILYFS